MPPQKHDGEQVKLYTLIGRHALHRDARVVRQLVEAVALSKGAASPADEIPKSWLPQLQALADARAAGKGWPTALAQAGLTVPPVESVHAFLEDDIAALWQVVPGLVGRVLVRLASDDGEEVLAQLKGLLAL